MSRNMLQLPNTKKVFKSLVVWSSVPVSLLSKGCKVPFTIQVVFVLILGNSSQDKWLR